MFKLNKKQFYIIEAVGLDVAQRELLKAKLKAEGINCIVAGCEIEIHEVKKNE